MARHSSSSDADRQSIQLRRERKASYLAELRRKPARNIPLWSRNELYDYAIGGDGPLPPPTTPTS